MRWLEIPLNYCIIRRIDEKLCMCRYETADVYAFIEKYLENAHDMEKRYKIFRAWFVSCYLKNETRLYLSSILWIAFVQILFCIDIRDILCNHCVCIVYFHDEINQNNKVIKKFSL